VGSEEMEERAKTCARELMGYISDIYHSNVEKLTDDMVLEMWDRIDIIAEHFGIKTEPHD